MPLIDPWIMWEPWVTTGSEESQKPLEKPRGQEDDREPADKPKPPE